MERQWATIPEVCDSLLSRSGFSANLAPNSFATSAKLPESRRLKAANELITEAPGIPTATSPTGQVGAVPCDHGNRILRSAESRLQSKHDAREHGGRCPWQFLGRRDRVGLLLSVEPMAGERHLRRLWLQ